MSKLNIDQKSVFSLFSDRKADFLIPDYQRPYAWGDKECQRLWDDIFEFAIPENDATRFKVGSEYFLGPIVTFKNDQGKDEIIDGQQRLTTLMLLLRAFYSKFGHMQDDNSKAAKENIEKCIWKTDEFNRPIMTELKIDSEVASDDEKSVFLEILKTGEVGKDKKDAYASNYRFFSDMIAGFLDKYPSYFAHLPMRILNNCILLPIEAESQDTALRIFSTLNDRGKPLSDADIFKAQFYKYFSGSGRKDEFIKRWKSLEEVCDKIFDPLHGTPMDEIFARYMYYERAKQGNKDSTTEALRKFYEKNSYALLKKDETFDNLVSLADFWKSVSEQDDERFSEQVLRRLFILNYAPNGMWAYIVSVYFMNVPRMFLAREAPTFPPSFLPKLPPTDLPMALPSSRPMVPAAVDATCFRRFFASRSSRSSSFSRFFSSASRAFSSALAAAACSLAAAWASASCCLRMTSSFSILWKNS